MRTFDSGATRDTNDDKPDYSGFLSPSAIKAFGAYMHKHRVQADGSLRASDNWKKGIPIPAYFESWIRHTVDFWDAYERGDLASCDDLACAIWFNLQGFLHERAKTEVKSTIFECHGNGVLGINCDLCVSQGRCVFNPTHVCPEHRGD